MSILPIILALLVLADLLTMRAVSRAPRGYEDAQGFHVWERKK